ncbi:coiled-coil and C2 domain-containing protein 1B [Periophthalmus magnuspinnatus]|uniref:coiled-coil and C2 domain-containing protein 1B n=1 Tax=Periophthalmus magnuspinnatus TaxID=409849 RepID=UPI00145C14CC|nr:coiled-coil and C2 domain-containing protein 1B [Periophthalmus magnuspinnatus]
MFGKKKKEPVSRGQGAAAAKQMGLFMDPEEMMEGMEENLNDPDLEAELAALTGGKTAARGRAKAKGKAPLPMEDIARMADECLRDIEDDDDENVEDDEDLLAELQEVVGEEEEEEEEDEESGPTTSVTTAESSEAVTPEATPTLEQQPVLVSPSVSVSSAAPGSVQHTLEERISMYQTALKNAKAAGETSKVRRIERGLKSLQSMLTAVKKGRSVNEADIPPPVATGASRPPPPAPTTSSDSSPLECTAPGEESEPVSPSPAIPEITVVSSPEEEQPSSESAANLSELPTPEESKNSNEQPQDSKTNVNDTMRMMLLERQREYKMGALSAKKQGDKDQAMQFFRISKGFDAVLEALGRGESVDLSNLPPSLKQGSGGNSAPVKDPPSQAAPPAPSAAPAASSAPPPPKDALEALEQRKAKYLEASAQAKANGDERKARMHDRIAKQYQNAIRAHKAGKVVNFDELPVPPGFPPIPGQKTPEANQGIVVALEAAHKLASTDVNQTAEEEEEEEGEEQEGESKPEEPKKLLLDLPPAPQKKRTPSPDRRSQKDALSPTSAEQVQLLENRRKQFLKAALQAKQKNELDQAKTLLRKAKGLEPMIEAARGGRAVDISQIPSPPGDEEDDFIMVHHSDVQISEKSEQIYAQLTKILQEQYEKCMTHSKQFTHLGNVKETTKFEKMAESCKKSLELLKLSHSRGLPPPKHHFEERALHTVGIFPELSSTEMVVMIVKGINLPAPNGIQTNDLDAFIKFDFPYPSTEQPQKHKTSVIKNTNCPEYNQNFTLTINRNHRGFRRLVTSKGLKLELFHKGGFLRSDKPIGTAVVKLEGLENQSEIREIVEVMDGRKHTGGRVDVKVRLREPLSGTELQTSSLKWLVIDQV